jgi:hypothetical protein
MEDLRQQINSLLRNGFALWRRSSPPGAIGYVFGNCTDAQNQKLRRQHNHAIEP